MKKLFTLLTLLVCVCTGAWAEKTTYDFSKGSAGTTPTLASSAHHKAGNKQNVFLATDDICNNRFCFQAVDNGNNHVFDYANDKLQQLKGDRWFSIVDLKAGDQVNLTFSTVAAGSSLGNFTIEYAGAENTTNLSATKGGSAISAGTVLESGTTYYVLADGYIDMKTQKNFYLSKVEITTITAPTIDTQPVSANYATGASATPLSVSATASAGSLTYQWYSNTTATTEGATELTGETSSTYTPSTASAGTTYYYCAVTDNNSTTNTDIVSVTVADGSAPSKPSIEGAPVSSITSGASVTLTASSTGSPTPTYQWYSNTTSATTVDNEHKISGATSSTYSPSTTSAGTTYYYVVATNSEGSATSDAVSVTVNARTDCELTKVVYSNSFDAFITQPTADPVANGTITAYYMSGDDAPTISSAIVSDGATYNVDGTTLTVIAEDGTTTKVYDITLSAVSPYTTDGAITFDGSETWVKGGAGFDKDKGLVFRKNADDGRISQGLTRLYFFVGPAKTVTLTNELISSNRAIEVYVNGNKINGITSIGAKIASIDIPCSTAGNNMIAIVSNQTGGDGAFTKMKLSLTVKSLKVQYKLGETLIKEETLETPAKNIGDSHTVPFRMYVEKDGALYQTTKNSSDPYYGDAVTLTENHIVTKSLSTVDLGGGTLELLEDLDDTDGENAGIRASNRSAYNNKAYTSVNELPAGNYTFIVKAMNKGRGSSVKVGDTTAFTIENVNASKGAWTDNTFTNVTIPAAGNVTLAKGGSNTIDCYDIIIAIRTGDAKISTTIANSGYSSLGSAYGLDFANATTSTENAAKLTAFAATESSQKSVKLVSIDEAPAATGVILKGTPGATYTIPVKADAAALTVTNLLHAAVTATEILGNTSYIMQGGQFHLVTADSTVPAGKAYLQAATGGAKALTVVFADDLTGVANVNAAEAVQPVKRIVNGQLVIEKSGKRYNAAGAEF